MMMMRMMMQQEAARTAAGQAVGRLIIVAGTTGLVVLTMAFGLLAAAFGTAHSQARTQNHTLQSERIKPARNALPQPQQREIGSVLKPRNNLVQQKPNNLEELKLAKPPIKQQQRTLNARQKKEELGDLGEIQSMRLQQKMDRKAKASETLSNVLKKASHTVSG